MNMAVESPFQESLLRSLKIEDPWLSPKPWESIASESGASVSLSSKHTSSSSRECPYDLSSVSESSLVRLVLNALEGLQSAVISIEQLSALLCADPADRSVHRIQGLWSRSLSTNALGKMLKSIGITGSVVVLLQKFVDFYTCSGFEGAEKAREQAEQVLSGENVTAMVKPLPHSLVNQAFAVAIRTVLEGYLCALATLNTSVYSRRSFNSSKSVPKSSQLCSLTSISHSEVTLLEIYCHTKELRTQIEGLGHLCQLGDSALLFSQVPFEDFVGKAVAKIHCFHRGGDLLTYLYRKLQVVDPAHRTLLKFLFLRSLEPYCRFVRSWIYEAKISDPYGEFIVECLAESLPYVPGKAGSIDFQLATIREHDGVVPCFLGNVSIQLLRAGQQLQVVMKLLRLCNFIRGGESLEDILPSSSHFSGHKVSDYPLSFIKREIEAVVLSRKVFYRRMHEKLEKFMDTIDVKAHQVILHDTSYSAGSLEVQDSVILNEPWGLLSAPDESNVERAALSMDSDASSMAEEFSDKSDDVQCSECSSTDGSYDQVDAAVSCELHDSLAPKRSYLSSLDFSTLSSECTKVEQLSPMKDHIIDFLDGNALFINKASCSTSMESGGSWLSEIQYAGALPNLGWPVGSLLQNPFSITQNSRNLVTGQCISTPQIQTMGEKNSCSSNQCTPNSQWIDEIYKGHERSSSSFLLQSWSTKYPTNVLSMNPVLTKNAFLKDVKNCRGNTSKMSKNFPHFDFSSASSALKIYEGRFSSNQRHLDGNNGFSFADSGTSAFVKVDTCRKIENATDKTQFDKDQLEHCDASVALKTDVDGHLENTRGGGSWQGLLGSCLSDGATKRECEPDTDVQFDMPLDFIIDKYLLQEILLQYNYVSRFCIKLLEEGFDLQEHFLALRRYHFMEIADWADLFVASLWHHKWNFAEADQNIPVIQGLLESSIQRSSCEKDHYKDHLYAYVKDQNRTPISTAAVGLHSFNFIGLGYRVDWPVSIVLTPSALNIYADIFTFLVQLKLAVISLADVWVSLKEFKHVIGHSSELPQVVGINFNFLVKLRHQINHFVSTLQQYVLSQLSDVSWCRFCDSLKHEVKDMMDLESVHMAYLMDSTRICFSSDDMQPILHNMKSILQCALDFRSCLLKGANIIGCTNQAVIDHISEVSKSPVHAVKENFKKNIKDLHLSYLKSPKHGEFGLPRFWSCLNYNDYYNFDG